MLCNLVLGRVYKYFRASLRVGSEISTVVWKQKKMLNSDQKLKSVLLCLLVDHTFILSCHFFNQFKTVQITEVVLIYYSELKD
jgi:hypothetical protein